MMDYLCVIAILLFLLFIVWAITPDDIGETARKYLEEQNKKIPPDSSSKE